MAHQLPGRSPGIGKTEMITNVIQTRLENLQHLLAGYATAPQCPLIHAPELPLEQPVIIPQFLLFDKAEPVLSMFAPGLRAVHTGTIITPLQVFRRAKNRDAKPAADTNARTFITSHV